MNNISILVSGYAQLNLGDDLFFKILFDRYPNIDFYLMANEDTYRKVFPQDNVKYFSLPPNPFKNGLLRKVLRKLLPIAFARISYRHNLRYLQSLEISFDAALVIGGSIFMEKKPLGINKYSLKSLFVEGLPGTPKFIMGANFGPFSSKKYLLFHKTLFNEYEDVCFRDAYSKSLFPSSSHVRYAPDVVFAGNFEASKKRKGSVGFSVIDLSFRKVLKEFHQSYVHFISQQIMECIDQNKIPYLFSFCKYEHDEKAIQDILIMLPKDAHEKIKIINYKGDIDRFLKVYSSMEKMFATRFHAMILSLIYRQQVVPVLYSNKMKTVLNDMGIRDGFVEINRIKESTEAQLSGIRLNSTADLKNQARKQFSALDKFLNL